MLSSSLERYLICAYQLMEKQKEIKSSDLAKEMNQPLQKTIQALQRMHYQKYMIYSPYQSLKFTDKGKAVAEYLLARDRLLDQFLDILHMTYNKANEKEAMSQYLSYENLKVIEKFVLFNQAYPELEERYNMLLQMDVKNKLLPPLPYAERS